jgi:hypothetical protein
MTVSLCVLRIFNARHGFAAMLCCLSAMLVTPPVSAQSLGSLLGNALDQLVLQMDGKCLGVRDAPAGVDGGRVQLADCNGRPQQAWRMDQGSLVNVGNGRCLEASGAAADRNPGIAQTWECNGNANQRWVIQERPIATAPALSPRDVEAGPLFSNQDAARRCPEVCGAGRWTGAWKTTVLGRMSVCNCVGESATGGGRIGPGARPMADGSFDALVQAMDGQSFATGKLQLLEIAARDNHFLMAQVRRVVLTLTFPSDKVRVVEIMASRVVDRSNSFMLYSAFDFEMEREQVKAIFNRTGPK